MAKKKSRHGKRTKVQLPPEYGELLEKIKRKTGQPKSWAAQVAIEHRARRLGIDFVPNWAEELQG
jgi:predicted DNA-binding protein